MSLKPNDIVIIDGVRSPMAQSKGGSFRNVRAPPPPPPPMTCLPH